MKGDYRYQIAIDETIDEGLTADLSQIEVVESVRGEATFKVRFAIDICKNDYELLNDDRLVPGNDVLLTVIVSVDGISECLVHGIITDRRVELKAGGSGSSLEVAGKDRRIEMGRNADERGPKSGTSSLIVMGIVGSYSFIPDVEPGDTTLYSELTQTLNQQCSDLELITKLAGESGYEFWIDGRVVPKGPGRIEVIETAHFKSSPPRGQGLPTGFVPPVIAPSGAPMLQMNVGKDKTTLLGFSSDRSSEAPTASGEVASIDLDSGRLERTQVDGPSSVPLGDLAPQPRNRRPVVSPGNASEVRRRQDAALIDASWIVTAQAETSLHALGDLIRPHSVVKVKGTGTVDDGDYFVWKVTHSIDAADHRMGLELRRNAVGSG